MSRISIPCSLFPNPCLSLLSILRILQSRTDNFRDRVRNLLCRFKKVFGGLRVRLNSAFRLGRDPVCRSIHRHLSVKSLPNGRAYGCTQREDATASDGLCTGPGRGADVVRPGRAHLEQGGPPQITRKILFGAADALGPPKTGVGPAGWAGCGALFSLRALSILLINNMLQDKLRPLLRGLSPASIAPQKTVDPKPNSLYIQDCHPYGPIAQCDRARPSIISRIILSSCSSVDAPVRFLSSPEWDMGAWIPKAAKSIPDAVPALYHDAHLCVKILNWMLDSCV